MSSNLLSHNTVFNHLASALMQHSVYARDALAHPTRPTCQLAADAQQGYVPRCV